MSPLQIRLTEQMDTEQESRSSVKCESQTASTCRSDGMLDLSSLGTDSPVSVSRPTQARQRNEFQSPEITLYDPDGAEARVSNANNFPRRLLPRSETVESETVLLVQDLGFKAASETKFPPKESPLINPPMAAEQICNSFRLDEDPQPHERDYKLTVVAVTKKKIEKMWKYTVEDEYKYLPLDAFEAIFTPDIINSLLKEVFHEKSSEERTTYLNEIVSTNTQKSRRRIAALLTFTNHFDRILQFIDEKIEDQHFPLTGLRHHKTVLLNNGVENMTLFKDWGTEEIDLLLLYQDKFFVPFFDLRPGSICSYNLGKSTLLPWLTCKKKYNTNNSRVYRVEIHPSHHNFSPAKKRPGPLFFALKEVVSADGRSYNDEVLAYERIFAHVQKDNHLIKLLLTFKQENRQYLMFEWADGNLKDLWENRSATEIVGGDSWMARQCIGLCGAIKRIHGLGSWDIEDTVTPTLAATAMDSKIYGRHGDIKPENILWFKSEEDESGRLVLADLGLTRYHSSDSRSKVQHADIRGYTGAYRAPEWDHKDEISQAYDIWSLGCVFLEFCIWFLEGCQQVNVFNAARQAEHKGQLSYFDEDNFFNSVYGPEGIMTAQVKPCIDEKIDTLVQLTSCPPGLKSLLGLIRDGMLVVDVSKRYRIDTICAELKDIYRRHSQDASASQLRTHRIESKTKYDPDESKQISTPREIQTAILRTGSKFDGETDLLADPELFLETIEGRFEEELIQPAIYDPKCRPETTGQDQAMGSEETADAHRISEGEDTVALCVENLKTSEQHGFYAKSASDGKRRRTVDNRQAHVHIDDSPNEGDNDGTQHTYWSKATSVRFGLACMLILSLPVIYFVGKRRWR